MTAPVLLVFLLTVPHAGERRPGARWETLSGESEGRFLVGLVDIDAVPAIAQAMQIPRCRSWSPSSTAALRRCSRTCSRSTSCARSRPRSPSS